MILPLLLLELYIFCHSSANVEEHRSDAHFSWPGGAKAAICLTYDDGLSSHVNSVRQGLRAYGFKATFFPTLAATSIKQEMVKWKLLRQDGHELGNHTIYHPCMKSDKGMEWIKDYHDLDRYSISQILDEIKVANSFLKALDGLDVRTFAYPCAHIYAGKLSFKDSLANYVTAARNASVERLPIIPIEDLDLFSVQSWAPNGHSGKELIAYVKDVVRAGTLSTFTFHGVGAEHMSITVQAHEELLNYLKSHSDEVWVTTFAEATAYVRSTRQKNN